MDSADDGCHGALMTGNGLDSSAELEPSEDAGHLDDLLLGAIARARALVVADVERARKRNPGLSQDQLARLVVKRGTRRVGAASFATGFGGAPTMALNISSVLTLQASLVLAVAAVYDELDSPISGKI